MKNMRKMTDGRPLLLALVMYFNCTSLPPKIDKLAALGSANKPNVVCLVEMWLSDDVLDSENLR